ncbi:MAG: type II toxin-antitoxin system prevent-host-death family antitoxin [Anaerolineae bacterium]
MMSQSYNLITPEVGMAQQVVDANQVRRSFRQVVDAAEDGKVTVIQRHGKRVAAIIGYEDYAALAEEIEERRLVREAEAELEAYRRDPAGFRDYEEWRADMIGKGLLDD